MMIVEMMIAERKNAEMILEIIAMILDFQIEQ